MDHFTASDGARIAFRDEGAGQPILCLSGLTRNSSDFDYLMPHLDLARFRVIRMDYRGRGQSQWTGADSYTVMREGQDALGLLDHLGLASTGLIGTSRGGLIGMLLGALDRTRLDGVCFVDVAPKIEMDGLLAIQGYVGVPPSVATLEEAATLLSRNPHFPGVPMERWQAEAGKRFVETDTGQVGLPYDPALKVSFEASMKAGIGEAWELLDQLYGKPVALVRGANSDLVSRATAEEMHRRRPDLIWADVPDRGHVPFLDEAESLAVIHRWLETLS